MEMWCEYKEGEAYLRLLVFTAIWTVPSAVTAVGAVRPGGGQSPGLGLGDAVRCIYAARCLLLRQLVSRGRDVKSKAAIGLSLRMG